MLKKIYFSSNQIRNFNYVCYFFCNNADSHLFFLIPAFISLCILSLLIIFTASHPHRPVVVTLPRNPGSSAVSSSFFEAILPLSHTRYTPTLTLSNEHYQSNMQDIILDCRSPVEILCFRIYFECYLRHIFECQQSEVY